MDLHRDIMNLPLRYGRGEFVGLNEYLRYKEGHRDDQNDASELTLKYERYIELMEDHFGLGMTSVLKRQAGLV